MVWLKSFFNYKRSRRVIYVRAKSSNNLLNYKIQHFKNIKNILINYMHVTIINEFRVIKNVKYVAKYFPSLHSQF